MIYAGVQEIHILSSDYNPIFNIRPGSETRAFLILGIASAVSGFVGLIRRKIIEF